MERGWKVSGRGRPVEWSCAGSGGSTERGRGGNGQRRALEPQQASAVAAAACPGAVARCRDPSPKRYQLEQVSMKWAQFNAAASGRVSGNIAAA